MRRLIPLALLALTLTAATVSDHPGIPGATESEQVIPSISFVIPPGGMVKVDTTALPNGPVNYDIWSDGVRYTGQFTVQNQAEEPRVKGPLETELETLDGVDKQTRKTEILRDTWPARSETWGRDDITYTVTGLRLESVDTARMIRSEVQARDLKGELFYDDFMRIVNPPILVPTGTYHREQITNARTGEIESVLVANYTENPVEAVRVAIIDTVRAATAKGPHLPGQRGTTTTIFSGTADGRIISDGTADTWANTQDRSTGGSVNNSESAFNFGIDAGQWSAGSHGITLSFFGFDTSPIADGDTIDDVTFSVVSNGVQGGASGGTIEARDQDWSAGGVTIADWVDFTTGSNWTGQTLWATLANSSWSNGDGNRQDFVEAAGFPAGVNKTGTTYLSTTIGWAADVSAPAVADNSRGIYYADNTGTTNDPRLVVNHSAGGGPVRDRVHIFIN